MLYIETRLYAGMDDNTEPGLPYCLFLYKDISAAHEAALTIPHLVLPINVATLFSDALSR